MCFQGSDKISLHAGCREILGDSLDPIPSRALSVSCSTILILSSVARISGCLTNFCTLQLGLIALAILCLESDHHGNGRHLWDITGYQYAATEKVKSRV